MPKEIGATPVAGLGVGDEGASFPAAIRVMPASQRLPAIAVTMRSFIRQGTLPRRRILSMKGLVAGGRGAHVGKVLESKTSHRMGFPIG